MTVLGESEIHLWLAYYDEIDYDRMSGAYRALLTAEERKQELRFVFARDRQRYLATRALVRTTLSRYAPIAPVDWSFSTNEYGRPEIANSGLRARLCFNISHTHSLIVLGVTRDRMLGVDVENVRERVVSLDIAKRFFATEEVRALATVPPEGQQERFFEYWTFKESYIKARGMGLSIPLDQFSFHFPHERAVQIAVHPELQDTPERWQFWQFRPRPQYLVAVCAERSPVPAAVTTAHTIVPLGYEQAFSPEFLRRELDGRESTDE